MIPNTIHCCWLGGKEKTALAKRCRESWLKYAPGWNVREWTAAGLAALDRVVSAREMLAALRRRLGWCDALVMTAAVADFRPARRAPRSRRRGT